MHIYTENPSQWQFQNVTYADPITNPINGIANAYTFSNAVNLNSTIYLPHLNIKYTGQNQQAYTKSIYAKAVSGLGTFTFQAIMYGPSTNNPVGGYVRADFNLLQQTTFVPSNSAIAYGTSASITSVGNGWYRCSVNYTLPRDTTSIGGEVIYLGWYGGNDPVIVTKIAFFAPQLEFGLTPTTYQYVGATGEGGGDQSSTTVLTQSGFKDENLNKNIITDPEKLTTGWSTNSGTLIPNSTLAPDGRSLATKLVEATTLGNQRIFHQPATEAGTVYTYSVYIKPAERYIVRIYAEGLTPVAWQYNLNRSGHYINFSLPAGSQLYSTYWSPTNPVLSYSLTDVGNGWYRYVWTVKSVFASLKQRDSFIIIGMADNSGTYNYTGDGTSGMYIWGAQMEAGYTATPYVSIADYGNTQSPTYNYAIKEIANKNYISIHNRFKKRVGFYLGNTCDTEMF